MDWLKEFLRPEFIWALVGLILLLMEFAMPGLIVFFFGVGAWIVALVCLFWDISINTQFIIFIAASVILLLVLRRWLKGIFVGHVYSKQPAGEDLQEFIGQQVVVTEAITPPRTGTVELNGVGWKAAADKEITAGRMVEIIGRDSLTLSVKPLEQGEDK
jgi:membrane protein implicated in regulation of membrane protease activity